MNKQESDFRENDCKSNDLNKCLLEEEHKTSMRIHVSMIHDTGTSLPIAYSSNAIICKHKYPLMKTRMKATNFLPKNRCPRMHSNFLMLSLAETFERNGSDCNLDSKPGNQYIECSP